MRQSLTRGASKQVPPTNNAFQWELQSSHITSGRPTPELSSRTSQYKCKYEDSSISSSAGICQGRSSDSKVRLGA